MHIEFRRLKLHNFFSFGDAELIFQDDGFIKVSGINNNPDDLAISNGSGKSSLWEGIIWVLTGDTIRGAKNIANIYGEDGTFCELEFDLDKSSYKIIRAKDHSVYKTSLQIYIDGKDCSGKGIRDSQKLLEQYLPDLSADLLGSVIVLGQGLPQKFTNNSPSARKEILEKLAKSDFMIDDLKKKITARKTFHQHEIRTFEDEILKLETRRQLLSDTMSNNQVSFNNLPSRTSLQESCTNLAEAARLIEDQISDENNFLVQIDLEYNKLSEDLLNINNQCQSELSAAKYIFDIDYNPLIEDEQKLVADLLSIDKQINQIKQIVDVCPTCGQHIPNINKPDTSTLEHDKELKLEILKNHRLKMSYMRDELTKENTRIEDKYRLKQEELKNELFELTTKKRCHNQNLSTLNSKFQSKQVELAEVQTKLANLDYTREKLLADIANAKADIEVISDQILYNNTNKDLQQLKLDIVSKFETAIKRDFRGYLLTTIIEYIESRAKFYSRTVFETSNLEFCLDGNNIHIAYSGKDYENLSGGERQKVDLIIQFSIRDMLTNHLNFSSNILVLDEIFDNLDQIGCEKVIDLISEMQDIKNIFIVTHRKDLSIPSDKELTVVKANTGISELQ